MDSRCLLSGYNVTLNSQYEAGTSIAGQSQSYTDIADFQATDPSGNAVTNPAGFTATVNWGDGTSTAGDIEDYPGFQGLFEIDGVHAYPNPSNGEYNIQVQLTDPDGGVWYDDPSIATVDPRPDDLYAAAVGTDTFSVTTGQPLSGAVAVVTIPYPTLTVTGLTGSITNQTDGTTTPAKIVPDGTGGWDVYDTEDFPDPGPNEIVVELRDQQGDTATLQGHVTVNAPQPNPSVPAPSGGTGGDRTSPPMTPQHPTPQNPPPSLQDPSDFNERLNWGDFVKRPNPFGKMDASTQAYWDAMPDGKGKWSVSVHLIKAGTWVYKPHESVQLLQHEQGHFDISALAARDLLSQIQGDSRAQATTASNKLVAQVNRLNDLYDTTTNHGKLAAQQQLWTQEINSLKSSPTGTFTQLQQWAKSTFP